MPLLNMAEQGMAEVQFQPLLQVPGGEPIRRVRVGKPSQAERTRIIEDFGYRNIQMAQNYLSMYETGPDASEFDIVVLTRRWEQEAGDLINKLKSIGVTVIYDIDDDAFAVPRMNPAYAQWGTDGGQILRWYHWLNKQPPFSPETPEVARAYNRRMIDGLVRCCQLADAVTVTTEALAKVYRRYNKNGYVIPNQMSAAHWINVRPVPHPGERWFGWAGSRTHYEDLMPMTDAVQEALRRVPDSYFVLLGFPEMAEKMGLPPERVRSFAYMPIDQYRDVLAGIEVVWAPSTDIRFNHGKSDIRCLESWMTLNPVVASEVTYGPTVRQAGGGYVAKSPKDWTNYTVKLLTDEEHRKAMALKGLEYTANERTYETQAHQWLRAYEQVRHQTERIAA
jgi:glycosyltransferase involved in cell wall biosynthesis